MPHDERKRTQKSGLSPGSLIYVGPHRSHPVTIDTYDYSPTALTRAKIAGPDGLGTRSGIEGVRWLDVESLHDVDLIEQIGERYGVHRLTLEDVLDTNQRPKIEEYPDYIFCIIKMVRYLPESEGLVIEQVGLVLGDKFVITFQDRPGDVFDGVRKRLEQADGRLRKSGSDYLAYALVDAIVDHDFFVIERIDNEIRELEDEVDGHADAEMLREIHRLRTLVGDMRRVAWPQRELLAHWLATEHVRICPEVRVFLRDVHDHAIQVLEALDREREVLVFQHDLVLSSLNLRASEVMQFLSVIGTIFMPLTFVAGVYGMNFTEQMPEFHWQYGYVFTWGVFIAITGGMIWHFKRKRWI